MVVVSTRHAALALFYALLLPAQNGVRILKRLLYVKIARARQLGCRQIILLFSRGGKSQRCLNSMTSPSATMYSFPSLRTSPFFRAASIEPDATKSDYPEGGKAKVTATER